ncbi:MAG: radical SAM protein [Sulfuricella sp.]|nr:radical SAM protein [Sulfuricella sp.]
MNLPVIRELFIELTSDCNLRCRYCALNLPGYVAHDMAPQHVEQVLRFVEQEKIPVVSVNVHGETTQVAGWMEICARLKASGAQLNIISNFARFFSDEEIATLAGFAGVRISIDSVDRELLRSIRHAVDLRIILHNLTRLRAAALLRHGKIPLLGINCVVSQRNVFALSDVIAFAAANGFNDVVLHDLAEITALPEDRPRHISSLPEEQRGAALQALRDTWALGQRLGLRIEAQANLQALVESGGDFARLMGGTDYFKQNAPTIVMSEPLGAGQTRHCLDPWRVAKVAEDGSVLACCIGRTRMGHLDAAPLDAIFQGAPFRQRRSEMRSGNLDEECRACPARGAISTTALQAELAALGFNC